MKKWTDENLVMSTLFHSYLIYQRNLKKRNGHAQKCAVHFLLYF